MHRRLPASIGLMCIAWAGCSSPADPVTPVSGQILLDGKPVEKGTHIVFAPEGKGPMAAARTDENGRFRLDDIRREGGVRKGTYRVVVLNDGNFVKVPWDIPPENVADPRWEKYRSDVEAMKRQSPRPGVVPSVYSSASTTPLRYKAPSDGSDVVFNLPSGASGMITGGQ